VSVLLLFLSVRQRLLARSALRHPMSSIERAAIEADIAALDHGPMRQQLLLRLRVEDDPRRPRRISWWLLAAAVVAFALEVAASVCL